MKKIILLITALILTGSVAFSQVKIGENAAPVPGAILDLNSGTKGGMLLPNVDITDLGKIPDTFTDVSVRGKDDAPELAGMVVWNTRKGWEGIYAWDGNEWKRLSGTPPAVNPETLSPGAGEFTGRSCFDVASSNPGGKCGELTLRQEEVLADNGARADFTEAITRNQTYTFSPSGKVSNVRFYYIEDGANKNKIVESISGGNMANEIAADTKVTCNIVYKDNLNSLAAGKTTENALKVAVYVVYNNGPANNGTDVMLKLDVLIKDCSCCGAYTVDGNWLTFMCYNLGADKTLVTPEQQLAANPARTYGAYFKWGTNRPWTSDNLTGWSSFNAGSSLTAWGYGTAKNKTNDPCPDGYRVPSREQWTSLYGPVLKGDVTAATANRWVWLAEPSFGLRIGAGLLLVPGGALARSGTLHVPNALLLAVSALDSLFEGRVGETFSVDPTYDFGMNVRCVTD